MVARRRWPGEPVRAREERELRSTCVQGYRRFVTAESRFYPRGNGIFCIAVGVDRSLCGRFSCTDCPFDVQRTTRRRGERNG